MLGVLVHRLTPEEALQELGRLLDNPSPSLVAYANAHSVNVAQRDAEYAAVLRRADLLLNDGIGITVASRLYRLPITHNLNGTDFTPEILRLAAHRGLKVYLFGGRPGVANRAAAQMVERIPGLRVVGTSHGHLAPSGQACVVEDIIRHEADVVLVALGNPLQELWLSRNLGSTTARLGVAVGGFLDFTAERIPRAPRWVRTANLEWCWRLAWEPARLFRRYLVGNPLFLYRVLVDRLSDRGLAGHTRGAA